MTQGSRRVKQFVAILLMAVMVFSAFAVLSTALELPGHDTSPGVSYALSSGAPPSSPAPPGPSGGTTIPLSPTAAQTEAAAAETAAISANAAKYSAIANSLEAKGVKADMIHLPSSEPAGYINGKLVPGPEYATDTEAAVTQGYSASPAPSGIAYYGQSGSDVAAGKVTTVVDTSSLAGTLNVTNLSTLYLDSDNPDQWGGQLNALLLNVSIEGDTSLGGNPTSIWAQNVVSYQVLNDTLDLVDNTWNFTGSSEAFPSSGTSTIVANDSSDINYGGELYIGQGPFLYAPAPYSVTLYLNTSLINPFICTAESSVYATPTCANQATGTAAYVGDQNLFYNYSFSDAVTHVSESGTYDWLTFHSGPPSSVFDPSNTRLAGFEASGTVKNKATGLTNDYEMTFGIGAFDGANQNVLNGSGTATLSYLNDCSGRTVSVPASCTPPAMPAYVPVPAALNFGSQTGECTVGMNVEYTGTTAVFSAGPFNLHPLWGYAAEAGVASGATAVTNDITVSGSPLTLSAQPYIFIFLEDTSVTTPAAGYAWAPDVSTWYLMPGTYNYEALLSDYAPQSGSFTVAATATAVTATLPYNSAEGIYTPLWALNNGQVAGISSAGAGTLGSQYVLFNNIGATGGELGVTSPALPSAAVFLSLDDYDFPSFAGLLLDGTTAYVNVHAEVTFLVGAFTSGRTTTDTYLQQDLYQTQHVTISNDASLNGWAAMTSLDGSPAAQNPIPQADLMIWDSTNDLVYSNTFLATKAASSSFVSPDQLLFFGGMNNVVWGNTFNDPAGVTKATPGTYAGIAESENGDLIYNNNFQIDNPAPLIAYNPYTELGPVTWSDTWNIAEQAATTVAMTVNGFALSGNIVGASQPFQGGNEWWNYGNSLNPATTTPYTNVVDYTLCVDYYPLSCTPSTDYAGISVGGDAVPLLGFSLTFTESGLPASTNWQVTILGVTLSSTSATIVFLGVPNGAYAYTIGIVPGWDTVHSGTATVDGAALNVPIAFTADPTVSVAPAGPLSYDVGQTAATLTATATYSPNHLSIEWYGNLTSTCNAGSIDMLVSGTSFTPSTGSTGTTWYCAVLTDSGLPGYSSTSNAVEVTVTGDPTVSVAPAGPFPYDVGQTATVLTATVSYSGPNTASVEWYSSSSSACSASSTDTGVSGLTFTPSTASTGTTWYCAVVSDSGVASYDSASNAVEVSVSADPTVSVAPAGPFSYDVGQTASGLTATVTYSGPNTASVEWYSSSSSSCSVSSTNTGVSGLSFTPSTASSGTTWYCAVVSDSGVASYSSASNAVEVTVTTGPTVSVSPAGPFTYDADQAATTLTATVSYTGPNTVSVEWYSSLTSACSSGSTDTGVSGTSFTPSTAASGTTYYCAVVSDSGVPGYTSASNAVEVTVVPYSVSFSESGLPSGLTWKVTVNGVSEHLTTNGHIDTLTFSGLVDGTYSYVITPTSGWHEKTLPYSGSVTVNGASVTEPTLIYKQVTYSVTFKESGLPSGLTWTVTVNGVSQHLTTDGNTDHLTWTGIPNGTYAYSVTGNAGWHEATLPYNGNVVVSGANVLEPIMHYKLWTYTLTFSESGLPSGLVWKVTVNGVMEHLLTNGGTDSLSWTLGNGTYSYSITAIHGWTQSTMPSSGNVAVAGADVTEPTLVYT
jgi:thermopsin